MPFRTPKGAITFSDPYSDFNNSTSNMKKLSSSQRGEIGVGGAIGLSLLAIIAVLGLSWVVTGNDFFLYKVFAPRMEQVRHDTYKQSQAYNDGMMQELRHAQLDYEKASPEHKKAIGSIVLHQFASYDEDRLPTDLQSFVQKLRREQAMIEIK